MSFNVYAIRSIEHPTFNAVLERQMIDRRPKPNTLDDPTDSDQSVDSDLLLPMGVLILQLKTIGLEHPFRKFKSHSNLRIHNLAELEMPDQAHQHRGVIHG